MPIKYISQENIKKYKNKTCFLRVDFNEKMGEEKNSYRFKATLPTIKFLLENNVKIVIASHRGRYGENPFSLKPFHKILEEKLNTSIKFFDKIPEPEKIIETQEKIILLENLRFYKEEEKNNSKFAKKIASLADFYVNEAFSVSHRKNASMTKITRFLPSFGGLHLQKELQNLDKIKKDFNHPFTLILGGAKTKDKVAVIKKFWNKIDNLLLGGGPANTFLEAKGINTENSVKEEKMIKKIKKYIGSEKTNLPEDFKKENNKILDIGGKTVKKYSEIIKTSKTIIWNGPMGLFEKEKFEEGTKEIWKAVLENKKSHTVIGGGETVSSFKLISETGDYNLPENIFISTGGGAVLTYLADKKMPGLKSLKK
jgi:phosphoglycerate kinase